MITINKLVAVLGVVAVLVLPPIVSGAEKRLKAPYTEAERRAEYVKRGHTFPIKEYVPNTPGWKRLMDERLEQVRALTNSQSKWDGWVQTMSAALTTPNFTEFGWGLSQAPASLTRDIRQAIFDGLPTARLESKINVIDGPQALFIDRPDLTKRALRELQPILEAWSGMELVPAIAYGFRLYRNESRLWMHVDRTQTHVISCIYHLASSEDSEPWPIVIESYDGSTMSVVLKPGDLLFYESAKNFHGRPQYFNGTWYSSLFVHFYPNDPEWKNNNRDLDKHYAIPPNWLDTVPSDRPKIEVYGTSMMEPDCPDSWCKLMHAVELEGPGEYGKVITGGGKKYSLHLDGMEDDEDEEL